MVEHGKDEGTGVFDASGPLTRSGAPQRWSLRTRTLDLTGPAVMGILNLTPDSFSDGGSLSSPEMALSRARRLVEEGADILDVGGESTRPGAAAVGAGEEMERILPFIRLAAEGLSVPLSVDTRNAEVAEAALSLGAEVVNDVSGLMHDPAMAGIVARHGAGLVLSHMRGTPEDMMDRARYHDVVGEVVEELSTSVKRARDSGVRDDHMVVDPGIGFSKTGPQNLRLLAGLKSLERLGLPVLVGPSRKRFIGTVSGAPVENREGGTIGACVMAYLGGARVFRVHDVGPVRQALQVARAILEAGE